MLLNSKSFPRLPTLKKGVKIKKHKGSSWTMFKDWIEKLSDPDPISVNALRKSVLAVEPKEIK